MGSGRHPALESARFFTTVAKRTQVPRDGRPEVAFAGRSNAGKSSAINTLCRRNRLAFASKTPGRTQALNYFGIGPADAEPAAFLVDTPGYGYAAVPMEVKKDWQGLAGWYLRERHELVGLVLMVDCRRLLTQRDLDLLGWVPDGVQRLLLLTKADKLGRQAQRAALLQVQDQYAATRPNASASMLLFSSNSGQGVPEARALIEGWFRAAEPARPHDDAPTSASPQPTDPTP